MVESEIHFGSFMSGSFAPLARRGIHFRIYISSLFSRSTCVLCLNAARDAIQSSDKASSRE